MDNISREECITRTSSKEQFSPVSKLSPARPTQGRNITGPARHIRDLTADIHAGVQQWNTLHLQGVTLLKAITQEKQNESYSQGLQVLCDKLEIICNGLDDVVTNFAEIARQMKLTASLDENTNKLFTTWRNVKFGQVAESIYESYSREAKVKRKVLEDVAHYYTESWKMLFLATWVHQPLLPGHLTILLESMLIETGHR